MVFCRGAHHGRAADIDVFNSRRQVAIWICYGGRKGVEVDDDHVDTFDTVFFHNGVIGATTAENAAVYFGMQGFYPAIHHFGESGVIRNLSSGDAVFCQQAEGAASR